MDTQQNDFSKGSIAKAILRLAVPMTVAQAITLCTTSSTASTSATAQAADSR
jgi:hypothetical protein